MSSGFGLVNGKVNSPKPGGGARSFTFKELAAATKNFREGNIIGKGGFGSVYKGRLDSGQVRNALFHSKVKTFSECCKKI